MPGQRGPAGTAPGDPVATGPPFGLCCRGAGGLPCPGTDLYTFQGTGMLFYEVRAPCVGSRGRESYGLSKGLATEVAWHPVGEEPSSRLALEVLLPLPLLSSPHSSLLAPFCPTAPFLIGFPLPGACSLTPSPRDRLLT